MLGLDAAIDGLPTSEGRGYLGAPDLSSLVRMVISTCDDVDRLNDLHRAAYVDCAQAFSWSKRAEDFVTALGPKAESVLV
jgi:hypothetical protein